MEDNSTETTTFSMVIDLQVLMDNRKCGNIIILDLSAAFDTVVHEILLSDCKSVGIDINALECLRAILLCTDWKKFLLCETSRKRCSPR